MEQSTFSKDTMPAHATFNSKPQYIRITFNLF